MQNQLNIGCHLSAADGYFHMGEEAIRINANTFQFFTRNPRGSKAKEINKDDIAALTHLMTINHFAPILAHAPYTLNPCSADPKVRDFALMVMADDFRIMENLPGNYYNFHPGSHVGQGIEIGIDLITDVLNRTLKPELETTILLETMSGKGSEVGSRFEEIQTIISRVEQSDKLGVCMDSCHLYSAGYNVVDDLDSVLDEFDHIVGLKRLKAFHLNDSMTPFASNKDRHEKIGKGTIGLDAIVRILQHPKLKGIPFYLETPNEVEGYQEEIRILRAAVGEI
jgi:deoxyribonuclease-4